MAAKRLMEPATAPATNGEPKPPISAEEAQAAINAEKEKRSKACSADIDAALKKHRCALEVGMMVSARGNQPSVLIVAVD